MKQFLVLAESITIYRNKPLLKGRVYPETEFIKEHIAGLEAQQLIEEVVAHTVAAADLEANPELGENGIVAGDTIYLPVNGQISEEEIALQQQAKGREKRVVKEEPAPKQETEQPEQPAADDGEAAPEEQQ